MSEYSRIKKKAEAVLNEAKWNFDRNGDDAELVNAFGIGQVNVTLLAVELADLLDLGDAIEDETSDLWDAAVDAAFEFEERTGAPH